MNVTLSELRTRARQMADMVNSNFVSDSELLGYINASYAELYDILTTKYEDYYTISTTFTISSGNTYALPSDFYKILGVDWNTGGTYAPIPRFSFSERNSLSNLQRKYRIIKNNLHITPEDDASGSYRLWYVPTYTRLVDDTDEVDGVNGWEEYIVVDVAIKMLNKEESNANHLLKQKADLKARIDNVASRRDIGEPETITDIANSWIDPYFI